MVRYERLISLFEHHTTIANNRNPYANISSRLYRNHDTETISKKERKEIMEQLALKWIKWSDIIKTLTVKHNIPFLSYERFCERPDLLKNILKLPLGVVESIDFKAKVKVKDYKEQSIINQNERQISKFTKDEIEIIGKIL